MSMIVLLFRVPGLGTRIEATDWMTISPSI
jgi:hypothetical protein